MNYVWTLLFNLYSIACIVPWEMLEGTEYTAAWCSVDNWQPLICGVYFYGKLKANNEERRVVLFKASATT